jgi:hypothetical protein
VSGLTPDTGYRVRVVATNNIGTTEGTSKEFSTLAETCATKPALCPPPDPKTPQQPPSTPVTQVPPPVPPISTPNKSKPKCHKGFKKKRVRGKTRCVKIKGKRKGPSNRQDRSSLRR